MKLISFTVETAGGWRETAIDIDRVTAIAITRSEIDHQESAVLIQDSGQTWTIRERFEPAIEKIQKLRNAAPPATVRCDLETEPHKEVTTGSESTIPAKCVNPRPADPPGEVLFSDPLTIELPAGDRWELKDDGYRVWARPKGSAEEWGSANLAVVFEYKHSYHPQAHLIVRYLMKCARERKI